MGLVGELELETLSTNHLLSYIIHDTLINVQPANICPSPQHQITNLPLENATSAKRRWQAAVGRKRKRQRRAKACKNKEAAESQRMTHIAVERNRRKLMNEHLATLKSLMPESYIHRGDQASIVGGAIEYVKELEHLLQTLEAQKLLLHGVAATSSSSDDLPPPPPFSQFFSYPQYTWSTMNNNANDDDSNVNSMVNNNTYKYTAMSSSSTRSNDVADIEVSLLETHANVRILSRRSFSQLTKMVVAFHSLSLSILHLNVTTVDPLVLYSISVKVEEGCQLISADEIADAVHHMLKIIEDEIALC